jgi:hypothetical protein
LPDGRWIPSPGRIDITIGRPMQPERSGWVEMVRLRDSVRSEIERELDKKERAASALPVLPRTDAGRRDPTSAVPGAAASNREEAR